MASAGYDYATHDHVRDHFGPSTVVNSHLFIHYRNANTTRPHRSWRMRSKLGGTLPVVSIVTRSAVANDASHIAVLLEQLGYPSTAATVANRLSAWFDEPHSALIVAEIDGALAGVAAVHAIPLLEYSERRGRLVALVVDDDFRRLGVGRVLVNSAEEQARVLGCRDMEITSRRDRAAAHRFYPSLGYDDVCNRAARYLKDLTQSAQHRSDTDVRPGQIRIRLRSSQLNPRPGRSSECPGCCLAPSRPDRHEDLGSCGNSKLIVLAAKRYTGAGTS